MSPPVAASLFVLLAACLMMSQALAKPSCPAGAGVQWLADPDDCSVFFVCHASRQFDFSCGDNVWDQDTKTCVGRGSPWDKCTIARQLDELNGLVPNSDSGHPCANSRSAVFAKADNCAQYYDCGRSGEATVSQDPRVAECKFPLLFNEDSKRCEHYDMVKCGSRTEPLDACDYAVNQCQGRAHCVPCNVRFPSCKGLPDGLNPWVGREFSPFFVLCEQQRPLYQGQCDNSKGTLLFDPVKRVCTEMKGNESG